MLLMIASINPHILYRSSFPKCVKDSIIHHGNNTVHIVHGSTQWNMRQLQLLKFVADTYKDYEIHVLMLETKERLPIVPKQVTTKVQILVNNITIPPTTTTTTTLFTKKILNTVDHAKEDAEMLFVNPFRNPNAFDFFEKLKKNVGLRLRLKRNIEESKNDLTYENLLKDYKNIKTETTNPKEYFTNTALQYYWMNLDESMLIFAGRLHELWQYGGISFYMPLANEVDTNEQTNTINKVSKTIENTTDERLKTVIVNSRSLYENLTDDLLTVDGKGLHMATKTACHSFFGEMLIKLVAQIDTISIPTLIQETLDAFCKRGAVEPEYCKAIQNL